eukprot:gene18897-20800_t
MVKIKLRYSINLHKIATILYIIWLMRLYGNFTLGPMVYLSLHGTYIIIWFIKEISFPDASWEREVGLAKSALVFLVLGPFGYWIAPYLVISRHETPAYAIIAASISMQCIGIFLHFCSDCQKYFTLKYNPGLITEGLFSKSRNCNYLGEILIYMSFGLLSEHWLPVTIVGCFSVFLYYPGMKKKDASLSRYKEFAKYKQVTGILLPKVF